MDDGTNERLIALTKKAEREAELSPRSYRAKLTLFALLGYAVIATLLIALLGLVGGMIASVRFSAALSVTLLKSQLMVAAVGGIWLLLKALWVRFEPPTGYVLKRAEYPALFAEIDGLKKRLRAPRIHEVILDRTLNAAVVQHPRLGVLGWHKNYLILGYQTLLTLSPEEMRSVLAHELGHLSGNHGRLGGWIYRARLSWARVMDAFDRVDSWGVGLMRKFFDWYSPRFAAYSFALARMNEYQADGIAAKLTSPDVACRALLSVHATAPYLEQRYWAGFFREADERPLPPHPPFAGLAGLLKESPLSEAERAARIEEAMREVTDYADTHPSLKDRLAALNEDAELQAAPLDRSAAEAWLGDRFLAVMDDFDREWLRDNAEGWQARFDYVSGAKAKMRSYAARPLADLTDPELWEYAQITQDLGSGPAATPLFLAYQTRHPEDPDAAFFIGIELLERGSAEGLSQLRLALKNAAYLERCAHAGHRFLKEAGREEDAEAWWQECLEQDAIFLEAQRERSSVVPRDVLISPEIEEVLLRQLVECLRRHEYVGKAWLAAKAVEYLPQDPVYVVAIGLKGFEISPESAQNRVAEALTLPGTFFVVGKGGSGNELAEKVIAVGRRIL